MHLIWLNSAAIGQYYLKLKIIHTFWLGITRNVSYRYNSICLPRLAYKDINRNTIHISKTLESSGMSGEYMFRCVLLSVESARAQSLGNQFIPWILILALTGCVPCTGTYFFCLSFLSSTMGTRAHVCIRVSARNKLGIQLSSLKRV